MQKLQILLDFEDCHNTLNDKGFNLQLLCLTTLIKSRRQEHELVIININQYG